MGIDRDFSVCTEFVSLSTQGQVVYRHELPVNITDIGEERAASKNWHELLGSMQSGMYC